MKHLVRLIYFKSSGKYYSEGEFETELEHFWNVVEKVKEMSIEGQLPGLRPGGKGFIVLIEAGEPWGVPHVIPVLSDNTQPDAKRTKR